MIVETFAFDGGNKIDRDFIVETLENGATTGSIDFVVASIISRDDVISVLGLDWVGMDGVGVEIIKEENIFETAAGGGWKLSGEVRSNDST